MYKIEYVLFDFGGVLAEEGFREGLHAIARQHGLEENRVSDTALKIIHETGYLTGRADENLFWKTFRKETGIPESNERLRGEILSRFILREWMFDLIADLGSRGLKTGILSDQTNWLDELNDQQNFFSHFDYIFNSYHMGKSKADPSHFDDIIDRLTTKGNRIIFVDDSSGNCERAGTRKIHAILYRERYAFIKELGRYYPLFAPNP